MKKLTVKMSVIALMAAALLSFSGCFGNRYIPKTLGDAQGMYLYDGKTKSLLNWDNGVQIVEQIEYDGILYDIDITDYRYLDDYFYFCAEFDNDNFIGLFRYDFTDKSTDTIFVKNIVYNFVHTSLSILHITDFFVTLEQCEFSGEGYCGQYEFGKHEYFSVDYSGNIIDTGFDDTDKNSDDIAYSDSYRLTRESTDAENVYTIEHLKTGEKITLGTVPGYQSAYYLNLYETDKLFCFITRQSNPDINYLVLYDKEAKTLHKELWGVSGDDAYVIDLDAGLFYADRSIYQYQANEGIVAIHSTDYFLSRPQVLHNGVIVFSAYNRRANRYSDYYYDVKNKQLITDAAQAEYYGIGQYFFDGYIFYVAEEHRLMWTTYYYLHRVNLATGENEIVRYSEDLEISFDRIGY